MRLEMTKLDSPRDRNSLLISPLIAPVARPSISNVASVISRSTIAVKHLESRASQDQRVITQCGRYMRPLTEWGGQAEENARHTRLIKLVER